MEERNNCVYKHTSPSGKVYIGITCLKPLYRWNNGRGYSNQPAMANAIKKYSWESFAHEIMYDNLTREEAVEKEKELIKLHKSDNPSFGYNCTSGGDAPFFVSNVTREKLSESKKRFYSQHPEHLEQMSNYQKKLWKDPIYREKMSKALSDSGKKHYAEHPDRAIAARKRSLERWSDPTFRERMKISMKGLKPGRYAIQRAIETRQTPVLCVEENRVFKSLDDAETFAHVRKSCIRDCCLGVQETSGGYHWRYENESKYDWEKRRNEYCSTTGVLPTLRISRLEDGKVFKNAHNAASAVGGDPSSIVKCCRGKRTIAYGYRWSYCGDEHLSSSDKLAKYSNQRNRPKKSVLCVECDIIFESVVDAANWVNGSQGATYQSILKCCRGERKSSHGYHWEYVD